MAEKRSSGAKRGQVVAQKQTLGGTLLPEEDEEQDPTYGPESDPIAEQEDEKEQERLQEAAAAEPELKRQATEGNRVPVAVYALRAAGSKQAEEQEEGQERLQKAAAGAEFQRQGGGRGGALIAAYPPPDGGGGFEQGGGTEAEHAAAPAIAESGSMPVAAYAEHGGGSGGSGGTFRQQAGHAANVHKGAAVVQEAAVVKQKAAAAAEPEPERSATPAARRGPVAAFSAHGGSVKKEGAMEAQQESTAGSAVQQEAAMVKLDAAAAKQEAAAVKRKAATIEPEPKQMLVMEGEKVAACAAGGGYEPAKVIEEGRIYFIYRPRVNTEHPHSLQDVQRFFLILCPTSRLNAKARLIVVAKKHLPSPSKHERFFGFVYKVADDVEELMQGLAAAMYETKTRGTREEPAARIAGEGVYMITAKNDGTTRLAYELEVPQEPGEVQKELGIQKEAAYIISIKNPTIGNPIYPGLTEKADFIEDQEKMKLFGHYRWIGVKDPSLLDYPRCEILLIGGAHVDPVTKEHLDEAEHEEVVKALHAAHKDDKQGGVEAEEAALVAQLHAELHPEKEGISTEPAEEGKWE